VESCEKTTGAFAAKEAERMRRCILIATAALVALVFACVRVEAAGAMVRLSSVKGDVTVQAQESGEWAAAADGTMLGQGASLRTGPGAEALVNWGAGHVVKVYQLSIVKIENLTDPDAAGGSKSQISLGKGKIVAKVEKLKTTDSTFTVRTPTAVAGVRGTAFECAISPETNQVSVSVMEGSVFVMVGDVESIIEQGFETLIAPGEAPAAPTEIPVEKMEMLKSETGGMSEAAAPAGEQKEEAPKAESASSQPAAEPTSQPESVSAESADISDAAAGTVADQVTIQNQVSDTIEQVESGCPSIGGCIHGTIEY
jgi:hypothetical protein